jgi:hypothetical protein
MFSANQRSAVEQFYTQNGYVEFSFLSRLEVRKRAVPVVSQSGPTHAPADPTP